MGRIAAGWEECSTPDGRTYFRNLSSGESVWEAPPEFVEATSTRRGELQDSVNKRSSRMMATAAVAKAINAGIVHRGSSFDAASAPPAVREAVERSQLSAALQDASANAAAPSAPPPSAPPAAPPKVRLSANPPPSGPPSLNGAPPGPPPEAPPGPPPRAAPQAPPASLGAPPGPPVHAAPQAPPGPPSLGAPPAPAEAPPGPPPAAPPSAAPAPAAPHGEEARQSPPSMSEQEALSKIVSILQMKRHRSQYTNLKQYSYFVLGKDWIESPHPDSGRSYYTNLSTMETTWTCPSEYKWVCKRDKSSNRFYYVNKATKESVWEVPEGYKQRRRVVPPRPNAPSFEGAGVEPGEDFIEMYDYVSNRAFFLHRKSFYAVWKDDAVPGTTTAALARVQALIRGYFTRRRQKKQSRGRQERHSVLHRFVEREIVYIEALQSVCAAYITPLVNQVAQNTPILPMDHVNRLFSNWNQVTQLHFDLYEKLMAARDSLGDADDTEHTLANYLAHLGASFEVYAEYLANLPLALEHLKRLQAVETFANFEQAASGHLSKIGSVPLGNVLKLPHARTMQYSAITERLLALTPESHPERKDLEVANQCFDAGRKMVVTKRTESDQRMKVHDLARFIFSAETTEVVGSEDRRLLYAGHLLKNEKKRRPRPAYLFSDALMRAKIHDKLKEKGQKYIEFKNFIPLRRARVVALTTGKDPGFELTPAEGKKWVFYCASVEEKDAWVNRLQETIVAIMNKDFERSKSGQPHMGALKGISFHQATEAVQRTMRIRETPMNETLTAASGRESTHLNQNVLDGLLDGDDLDGVPASPTPKDESAAPGGEAAAAPAKAEAPASMPPSLGGPPSLGAADSATAPESAAPAAAPAPQEAPKEPAAPAAPVPTAVAAPAPAPAAVAAPAPAAVAAPAGAIADRGAAPAAAPRAQAPSEASQTAAAPSAAATAPPTPALTGNEDVATLCARARRHYMEENYREALQMYQLAVNKEPNNAEVLAGVAFVYQAKKKYNHAINFFRQSIAIQGPGNATVMLALASALEDSGDGEGARAIRAELARSRQTASVPAPGGSGSALSPPPGAAGRAHSHSFVAGTPHAGPAEAPPPAPGAASGPQMRRASTARDPSVQAKPDSLFSITM